MTLKELLHRTKEWFAGLGIETARLDAEVLIAHALQVPRITLYTDGDRPLSEEDLASCRDLVARRGKREPIAYIVGTREFWSLEFAVDKRVLIPRPDTETLVQVALEWLDGSAREDVSLQLDAAPQPEDERGDAVGEIIPGIETVVHYDEPEDAPEHATEDAPAPDADAEPYMAVDTPPAAVSGPEDGRLVLDYGTGSGAIGVSMATERPGLKILALDISRDALQVAKDNAAKHGVSDRIGFVCSDGFAQLPPRFRGRLAAIIANPPYIPLADADSLAPDVREHEPRDALFAGPDPLEHYRRIADQAGRWLRPDGFVAVEVGFGQAADVAALFTKLGWVEVRRDLSGIERVVVAGALARRRSPGSPGLSSAPSI